MHFVLNSQCDKPNLLDL